MVVFVWLHNNAAYAGNIIHCVSNAYSVLISFRVWWSVVYVMHRLFTVMELVDQWLCLIAYSLQSPCQTNIYRQHRANVILTSTSVHLAWIIFLTPTVAIWVNYPVLERVKPSFVIFDIEALWRMGLSVRVPRCQKLQMTA